MITVPWFAPLFYLLLFLSIVWFLSVMGPILFGAPWLPMPVKSARRMLQLAAVRPGETVFDLGSGDGRMLIVAAREFGAQAVGVEIEPMRAFASRLILRLFKAHPAAHVVRANLFDVDLSQADVVTLYLLANTNARLVPKLRRELKPGARVVTLAFPLPGWEPAVRDGNICVYRQGPASKT
jgi:SAM-dependent methyltransferase